MPDVSVLLRTYNRRVWLQEAVESVLSQEGVDFELIITDAGDGGDGTPGYLLSLTDPRVKLRRAQPEDFGCVTIPEESSGKYICFLCDDDRLLPDSLRVRFDCLEQYPNRHMVFSSCENTDGEMMTMGRMSETNLHTGATFGTQLVSCTMPIGTIMVYRPLAISAMRDVRAQNITDCGDWLLWLFCLCKIEGAAYLAQPTFQYRDHANSSSARWGWGERGFAKTHSAVWRMFLDKGVQVTNPLAVSAFKEVAALLEIEVPAEVGV